MNEVPFFINLVKGWHRPERFEINLWIYTNCPYNPLSSLTHFGGCISWTTRTFSGSRWIPLDVTTNIRNLPLATPKEGFGGVDLKLMRPHNIEYCLQICYVIAFGTTFYYNIVNIAFHYFMYMLMKNYIHNSLLCCPCILQSKGHDSIAIHPQWCPKRCMLLIVRVHFNLIVS